GTSVAIPYNKTTTMSVQKRVPFFLIGTQAGSLTTFTRELNIRVDVFAKLPAGLLVFAPTYPKVVNPAWDETKMALIHALVSSTKQGSAAPCNDKAGVTFSIVHHPEAVVKYGGNGSSTGSGGDA